MEAVDTETQAKLLEAGAQSEWRITCYYCRAIRREYFSADTSRFAYDASLRGWRVLHSRITCPSCVEKLEEG